nr:zinc-ribbon domain-containing protein [Acidobacteriota bacterium]
RKLSVSLRPSSAAATVATFDFAVVHGGFMTDGDKKTLELEADAVVALAAAPPDASFCRNCGTENPGDARFCRLCGAPGTGVEPAELEVVRLTAGARASLQEVAVGLLIAVGILAITLPMILLGKPKLVNIGWALLAVGQAVAWWMTLYGVLRLYRTLNPKGERARQLRAAAFAPALHAEHPPHTSALPPAPARVSVTEGTTELLTPTPPRRERPDTHPFERNRQ